MRDESHDNVQICGDGNYVMTAIGGVTNFQKLEALLGLEGDPDFAEPHAVINKSDGPRAEKIVKAMTDYCMARTAEQVNDDLNALKLPCTSASPKPMSTFTRISRWASTRAASSSLKGW